MRRLPSLVAPLLVAVLHSSAGCSHPKAQTTPPSMPAVVVPTCTQMAPCVLQSGAPVQGLVGTVGQVNEYSITVPAGKRPILQIQLTPPMDVSPVQLVFTATGPTAMAVLGTRGPSTGPQPKALAANFLTPGPGTYEVVVHDANGTESDPYHPYSLTVTAFDDPDMGEPDDTVPMARAVTLGTALQGFISFSGDHDLAAFQVPSQQLIHIVLDDAGGGGPMQLQAQLLQLNAQTPDNLITATSLGDYLAINPGDALHVDVVRLLPAGSYVVELTDVAGTNSDARPAAAWNLTLSPATNPDPGDMNGMSNDTAATAISLPATGTSMVQGDIGYDGDRDWFHVAMPASAQAQIVQIGINPLMANSVVPLLWAVGTALPTPAGDCNAACGPTLFCSSDNLCGYTLNAMRDYAVGDQTSQEVRIRVQGTARDIYILVQDQGDDGYTTDPYTISVSVFPDPDPNEPTISNDTIPTATPVTYAIDSDGGLQYQGTGMISWWNYIDGVPQSQEAIDTDYFELPLPPLVPAPCPVPPDGGFPDGGLEDGGLEDGGLPDGGCPTLPDGGTIYLPNPSYGLTMHWHGPADGTYLLGLQGVATVQSNKTACLFSFDQTYAHADGDGGYVFGELGADGGGGDPCLCLPSAQSSYDSFWVRVDGPHRPDPPAANAYSDEPYGWTLDLSPNRFQTQCAGKCAKISSASTCP